MPRGVKPVEKVEVEIPQDTRVDILSLQTQDVAVEIEIDTSESEHHCLSCSRSFKTSRGLKRHVSACKPVQSYKKVTYTELLDNPQSTAVLIPEKNSIACGKCSKKFKFKSSYEKHLKEEHSIARSSKQCPECPIRCPTKKKLKKHMETHSVPKTYCDDCGQSFSRPYHLVRHLRQKGCGGAPRPMFDCKVCHQSFSRKDNLMAHLRWHVHMSSNGYQCQICNKTKNSLSSLIRHRMQSHEGNIYECDTCGRRLGSRVAFTKHLLVHGEKNFACDSCDFRCKSKEILYRHSLRHSEVKPFACSLCPRSFIQQHELTAHLFRHTGNSSIICELCGECFSSRQSLKSHIGRVHEGRPPLHCPFEDCKSNVRPFCNELSLRMHIKSHGEKPFGCRFCDKSFHLKAALSSHELTHQWDSPRRCPYCVKARAYIRGDLLLKHIRIKHPDDFADNLKRVRQVLGMNVTSVQKISKKELDAMLNMIDAIHENRKEQCAVDPLMTHDADEDTTYNEIVTGTSLQIRDAESELSAVMNEEELATNIEQMLERLIDRETLECLGWPQSGVDTVLESVLQQCSVRVAEVDKFSRAACLRENTKQLFLRVIEDETITRMMNTRTVDEVIRHVVSASE